MTEVVEKLSDNQDCAEKYGWGYRHVLTTSLFGVMSTAYMLRVNMSVAIIAMTDQTTPDDDAVTFDWTKKYQDYILSSFYWGYTIMQIPAGQLAHRYGGKLFIAVGLVLNGLATFAIPFAATNGGWKGVCLFRALQGLSQGCFVPSIHTILGQWCPVSEKSTMGTIVYSGGNFGMIVGTSLAGFLLASSAGWPSIFYMFGAVSIIAGVIWFILGADSPAKHPFITHEEKVYIENTAGNKTVEVQKVPWKSILTSGKVISVIILQCGCVFGFIMMLNETPSYLKMALKVNVQNSAFLATLPSVAALLVGIVIGSLSDFLVNKKIVSTTTVRKLCSTLGSWTSGLLLILLTMVPAGNVALAVIVITLLSSFDTIAFTGYMLNHLDLSPRFAGTLVSLGNFSGSTASYLAPLVAGALLTDPSDVKQWRNVFFVASGIYFVCNLCFLLFGTSETQPWDSSEKSTDIEITQMEAEKLLIDEKSKDDKKPVSVVV